MARQSNKGADGNPKAASTRIGSCTAKKMAGQVRHDLRRGPQPGYVDTERAPLNRVLVQPLSPGQMRSICEERRALRDTERAMKSNAAIATRGVITFGSEAAQLFEKLTPAQQDAAFREVAQAVADRLATSLHALVVHLDEATIHAHYQLAAYNVHGEPISKTTSPKVLSELQDITAEIMARHCPGIERGTRYGDRIAAGADFADTLHKSVKELHRDLPRDLEAKRAEVAEAGSALSDAQARVEEMQGRVAKLTAKERELTAAEAKRLATYEKRLADRQAEAAKVQQAVMDARAEVERLSALVKIADSTREEAAAQAARVEAEALAKAEKAERVAAKATALMRASVALADEMAAGTLRRADNGKIDVADPDAIRPGWPDIAPALKAGADARAKIEGEEKALQAERKKLSQERQEVAGIRQKLLDLVERVQQFLRRPDVSRHMKAHEDGRNLTRDMMSFLRKPKPAPQPSASPKKPVEDPDGPSGP